MTEMRAKLVIDADGTAIPRVVAASNKSLDQMAQATAKAASGFGQLNATSGRSSTALVQIAYDTKKLSAAFTEQAKDLVATQRESAAYRAELDRVRAQFDPLFAATRSYEKELLAIADAEKLGALSAETATAARNRAKAGFDAVTKASGKMFASVGGGGMVAKNLAFQLNQIGQQGAVTGNYLGALSIQLPDILAAFGFWGVLIGGVTAVLAPMAVELLKNSGAVNSLDDKLDALSETTQSATERLKILRDQDLSLTFGNMAGDVRQLTSDLLALDRAAELKNLQEVLDGLLKDSVEPNIFKKWAASFSGAYAPSLDYEGLIENLTAKNYDDLTGGRGPSFDAFESQRKSIMDLAKSGDIEAVTRQVSELINSYTGGGPLTDLSDDLRELLLSLGNVAEQTARVEADFNGSALAARITKEVDTLSRGYREQQELAAAVLKYGEQSAEVEAVRNTHAREALSLRLREMGVVEGSADEWRALVELDAAQAAEAKVTAAERQKSISEILTGLGDELSITQAIIAGGENGAEVERLRTEQAKETLRIKLEELGATDEQIVQAEKLLEMARKAAREQERAAAEKKAGESLAEMQREAQISQAILAYGKDSLQVKQLQIEAAREEYSLSLATKDISQETRDDLLAQWDQTKGLKSADPFGSLAGAQSILKAQAESLSNLELEQSLIGQSETVKRQTLALYEAELEIRKQNIDAESDLAQRIRDGALAESDRAAQVERIADAWGDVQSASEDAIDKLLGGDFSGALDSLKSELQDLAINNPIKNILLGTDYGTLSDLGGLGGIWDRLTGKTPAIDPASAARDAARSVGTMQVMATNVTISSMSALGLGGIGSAAANINGLPGSGSVQAQIAAFFSGKGLAPHQIAGIMGNISAESAFNPLAVGDGGTSFGLFQHHAGRGQGLLSAVGGMGGLGDIQKQLEYVWQELLGSENGVLQKLFAATNVQDATAAFTGFERPAGWSAADPTGAHNWAGRLGAAEQAMTQFNSATTMATEGLGTLGTGFDSFGQALAGAITGGGSGTDLLGSLFNIGLGALGLPGFAVGGPTGGSDPRRVAGLVHEGEYVFTAAETSRIGVENLQAISRGTMRGYATGGYVTAQSYPFLTQASAANSSSIDTRPVIQIVNQSSAQITGEVEETTDARGQRSYTAVMSDAVDTGLSKSGGKAQKTLRSNFGVKRRGTARW